MSSDQRLECAELKKPVAEIYCISLEGAVERQEVARQQLDGTSFKWFFLDAVNGKKLSSLPLEYDKQKRICLYGYEMTPGEIGCFMSHRNAWQLCVDSGRPIVVLEDDFLFTESADELYAVITELSAQSRFKLIRMAAIFAKPMEELATIRGLKVVKYQGDPAGTAAYLIHPDAAQHLLKNSIHFYMPVDDFMNQEYLHGVQYLGVVPYPIGTRAVPSTIDERRKHHLNLLMKLRREVYRIPEGFARWLYKIRQ